MTEVDGTPLFSDDALDAFARAMNNDDSRLGKVFGNKSKAITVRRDMEMSGRMLQQIMNGQPDGDTSFLADMARLRESLDAFMATDLEEENGDDYEEDECDSDERGRRR
jgi:nucleoside-diphosphate-sugar epimerase